MSYQVLARKWRPHSFREMVGQAHVLKALINALDNQRLHHAYLFTGTRGVGKTTIARILAKCLNCEEGVSSTPCGHCATCREIDQGSFIDLIEVDAASRTKVEDTRELLENVQYSPSRGRYKVYLIDEVHMLSSHSFNALLKTLEEPPEHVKFLLATTDPKKLPVTILSRCLQFSLKNLQPERIVEHLSHVLTVENIPFETDALWLLGRAADGSMRDAMSLTDQAIAFGDGRVMAEDVRTMLGTLDQGQVYGLLVALFDGDACGMLENIGHLAEQGPDWNGVLAELLSVLHRIALAQVLPAGIDNSLGDRDRILQLADLLPAEDVQFFYQMALIGRRDLPLAPDPRSGFEMVMLRMLAFRPVDETGGPGTPLKTLGIDKATVDGDSIAVSGAAAQPGREAVSREVSSAAQDSRKEPETGELTAAALTGEGPAAVAESLVDAAPEAPVSAVPPVTEAASAIPEQASPTRTIIAEPEPIASVGPDDHEAAKALDAAEAPDADDQEGNIDSDVFSYLDARVDNEQPIRPAEEPSSSVRPATGLAAEWLALYPQLKLGGLTGSIAANCTLVERGDDVWVVHLDPSQSALFNPTQQKRLEEAIGHYLDRAVRLDVVLQRPEQETPAQAATRERAARQRAAEQAIAADPVVCRIRETFAATVRDGSIEPLCKTMPEGERMIENDPV